ncbi:F-box/WD-40 repeat-containing protein [Sesbania bispinosa]|nr:F-box/WD-40 repeat-containing protein [Sesbania bispinosa]
MGRCRVFHLGGFYCTSEQHVIAVQPPFSATVPSPCRSPTIVAPSLAAFPLRDAAVSCHSALCDAAVSRHAALRDYRRTIPMAPRSLAVRFPRHPHLVHFFLLVIERKRKHRSFGRCELSLIYGWEERVQCLASRRGAKARFGEVEDDDAAVVGDGERLVDGECAECGASEAEGADVV